MPFVQRPSLAVFIADGNPEFPEPMNRFRILNPSQTAFYLLEESEGVIRTGWLAMTGNGRAQHPDPREFGTRDDGLLPDLSNRLIAALRGKPADFGDVPTPPGTDFQMRCWNAARAIPHGERRSYIHLATTVRSPGAARAVGQAMRRNPLPIIVPCHRVVSSSGIGGFGGEPAGGSTTRVKEMLLWAEEKLAP